jgi:asparagine synthetase B (glutamine-hydrolysing)
MCGIAGASFDPGFEVDALISDVAAQMLLDIEHRGTHATGIAWYRPDGRVRFRKDPLRAKKFVRSILPSLDVGPTFIAHTRFATQGSPKDRRNNHPFLCGRIVGIHNGVIDNDEALTARFDLRRTSETDSEVIFRLLERFGAESHSTLEEIRGSFAIAYLVADEGALYIARGNGAWETLYFITSPDGFLFCSCPDTVQALADLLGMRSPQIWEAKPGYWAKVVKGQLAEERSFAPQAEWWECYSPTPDTMGAALDLEIARSPDCPICAGPRECCECQWDQCELALDVAASSKSESVRT